jgi:hypothetical protein
VRNPRDLVSRIPIPTERWCAIAERRMWSLAVVVIVCEEIVRGEIGGRQRNTGLERKLDMSGSMGGEKAIGDLTFLVLRGLPIHPCRPLLMAQSDRRRTCFGIITIALFPICTM